MNGLALKLAIGNARHARVGEDVGSILIPDAQEKRIFSKLDAYQADLRNLQKTIQKGSRNIAFGLGASAAATLVAGAAVVWGTFQDAKRARR